MSLGQISLSYRLEENFKSLFINRQKNPMKVFTVNIGTFEPKCIELTADLKSLKYSFQVIALTEIGQTSQEFIEFIFPNFEIYMMEAPSTRGGLPCFYSKILLKT